MILSDSNHRYQIFTWLGGGARLHPECMLGEGGLEAVGAPIFFFGVFTSKLTVECLELWRSTRVSEGSCWYWHVLPLTRVQIIVECQVSALCVPRSDIQPSSRRRDNAAGGLSWCDLFDTMLVFQRPLDPNLQQELQRRCTVSISLTDVQRCKQHDQPSHCTHFREFSLTLLTVLRDHFCFFWRVKSPCSPAPATLQMGSKLQVQLWSVISWIRQGWEKHKPCMVQWKLVRSDGNESYTNFSCLNRWLLVSHRLRTRWKVLRCRAGR